MTLTLAQGPHTCDTFLNPNREIRNFFCREIYVLYREVYMLQISDFFTEVKVAKSSDIARNMLPSITMLTYMPTEVRKCVRLQSKKPPLILF